MPFSETFLQGFQIGAQRKLQQEAAQREAERNAFQQKITLQELKLRQDAAAIEKQKADFASQLHPLELEKAISEAGLVPADAAGGAPGAGSGAGTLPPPASSPALGASPVAADGTTGAGPATSTYATPTADMTDEERKFALQGIASEGRPAPEPAPPQTLSEVLNIGGKSFRRKTLQEKIQEAKQASEAKAAGDLLVGKQRGEFGLQEGRERNETALKEGAARNATSIRVAEIGAQSRERVADTKAQASASALKKNGDGSWSLASDIVAALTKGGGQAAPSTRAPLSAASRNTIDKSAVLLDLKKDAQDQLDDPAIAQHLGPVGGRITSVAQLIGNPDPGAQKLFGTLTGIAALSLGIHAFRNAQEAARITDEFFKSRYEPAAIRGALEGITGAAKYWERLGVEHGYDVSGNGATGQSSTPASTPGIVIKSIRPKS